MNYLRLLLVSTVLCVPVQAYAGGGHHHGDNALPEGVTVGGHIEAAGAFRDQDVEEETRDAVFYNDTEVHVRVNQKASNGLRYGAVIELEADVTEADREEGLNADKTYLFGEGSFGRVELGANSDAGSRLQFNSANFAVATGGIHGDWHELVNFPGGGHHGGGGHSHGGHDEFIHAPALPLHHAHGAQEDANKITYFTPSFNGFQAGVSYIPDSEDVGTAAGFTGEVGHARAFSNVLNGGLSYEKTFDEVTLGVSATGEFGEAETSGHADLSAYAFGTNLEYQGFKLGGSYGNWNDSINHTPAPDAHYWDIGAGYSVGQLAFSIGYLNAEYRNNETSVVSTGVDYALADGFTAFAEYTNAALDADDPAEEDNDANVIIIGTSLGF